MKALAALLAAGRGRRAGGPKAWLEHQGRPLLLRQLDFLLERFAPEDISVSIQKSWASRCAALHAGVRWVEVDPDSPPMASLLEILRARPGRSWMFFYHVDMPVWEPGLFEALYERSLGVAPDLDAVVPTFQGRRGHPVLLSPSSIEELLKVDPARERLDEWLKARKVSALELPFACVLQNWNSPPQP